MKDISVYDFPDQAYEPDGYSVKQVPDLTRDNLIYLIERVNELTAEVRELRNLPSEDEY